MITWIVARFSHRVTQISSQLAKPRFCHDWWLYLCIFSGFYRLPDTNHVIAYPPISTGLTLSGYLQQLFAVLVKFGMFDKQTSTPVVVNTFNSSPTSIINHVFFRQHHNFGWLTCKRVLWWPREVAVKVTVDPFLPHSSKYAWWSCFFICSFLEGLIFKADVKD